MTARPATIAMRADSIRRYGRLLHTARELFAEKGYERTSLDQLVARAGGSKSSIYAYFRNKEGLFRAVMEDMMEDLLSPLESPGDDSDGLENRLRAVADRTLEVLTSPTGISFVRLVHAQASRHPELGESYFRNGPERAINELARTLETEIERGRLSIEDPRKTARLFWGMMLFIPMTERMCGVIEPMSTRQRRSHVEYVVREFIARFAAP